MELEGRGRRGLQLAGPIAKQAASANETSAVAAIERRPIGVEFQKIRQASLAACIKPIDYDPDGIELIRTRHVPPRALVPGGAVCLGRAR
ncbi:bsr8061 [Bradyrhizobium diazoefficiens USDA 110]|uniref:Bsr8061 protein n=1 Tax=Bradyrhizobium diazoefficiens (strain JCM 10833 / BCRC 13528 / IAM 13628 / NBRC 14792 / USDA 110) TaxID=224911 RepID=Q89BT7_BRADU|nr:bsr8061 [Bradyrhizobium diazoefficiens USDA 110]